MTRASQTRTSDRRKASSTGVDCATAFQKIAFDCVAQVETSHGGAVAGTPEALHEMRVALTRLRAVVSFFAPLTVDTEWRHLKKEIAWLNALLGDARDSDVLMTYTRRKRFRAWAQRRVHLSLERCQVRARRRLARCLNSQRCHDLIEAITGWIKRGPWLRRWQRNGRGKPLKAYCERKLNRWRRQLIRKGRRLESLSAPRRHRLRIRTKRLRYMLEALTDVIPLRDRDQFRQLHGAAKRLQRVLGDLRDLKRLFRLRVSAKSGNSDQSPPHYRRQSKKLLREAVDAYRRVKQAGAC
jgi:CHAD domain-containing protein